MRELIGHFPKSLITAAIIDKKGKIISISSGNVYPPEKCTDPTAHSEVDAIRKACKKIKSCSLKGHWLYSTFEPCPLCSSAAVWAGVDGIVYSNNPKYRGKEDNWSFIPCQEIIKRSQYLNKTKLHKDFLIDETKHFFLE
ncbi:tRNA-specific adenosine deaminase [Candidatus Pacearchaeota archaeon]|nr:tRNA-specific adenosine deaminase [Candidatus Pacearchaeota archaeon]